MSNNREDPQKYPKPSADPLVRREEVAECRKDCREDEQVKPYFVCSNEYKTYENFCDVVCDRFYENASIRVKYLGSCDNPRKLQIDAPAPFGDRISDENEHEAKK